MKKIAVSVAGVLTLLVLAFFWLNNYIYQEKQADIPNTERVSMEGEYLCLPTQEDQNVENADCAAGIKNQSGEYYALDLGLLSQSAPALVEGDLITASGVITPIENISTDYWQKYPIQGIFSITDSLEVVGKKSTEEKLIAMYRGTLPCASCEGIETELSLRGTSEGAAEGMYHKKEVYKGETSDPVVTEGVWVKAEKDGKVFYALQDSQTNKVTAEYVVVDGDTIRLYGEDGSAYSSNLDYDLIRVHQKVFSPILNNAWIWQQTLLKDGSVVTPKSDSFVLSFLPTEEYTSTTDCNTLSGTFLVDREVLSLSPAIATKMYCEGSLESEYVNDLMLTNSFTIENGMLRLNLNRDYGTMIFVPQQ